MPPMIPILACIVIVLGNVILDKEPSARKAVNECTFG